MVNYPAYSFPCPLGLLHPASSSHWSSEFVYGPNHGGTENCILFRRCDLRAIFASVRMTHLMLGFRGFVGREVLGEGERVWSMSGYLPFFLKLKHSAEVLSLVLLEKKGEESEDEKTLPRHHSRWTTREAIPSKSENPRCSFRWC